MSIQIQHKIKQNALQIKEYVTDLYDWQKEMQLKEKTKAKLKKQQKLKPQQLTKSSKANVQPAPRVDASKNSDNKAIQKNQVQKQKEKKKDLIRDINTVGDYYKAWDKYDADGQLKKLQEEQERKYRPYNPYQDNKNNLRAKPQTKITVSGRRNLNIINDPSELKDKGNLHFQSLQYEKAITCYTDCLRRIDEECQNNIDLMSDDKKKLKCIVLSNRSMTYLKMQETLKALKDAQESLSYNDKYSKSYYRRAECMKKLGKYKESLRDFRIVRKLEPNETKADAQIKRIEAFLSKRCKETKDSMVMQYNSNLLLGGRRIQIEEVQMIKQDSFVKNQGKVNYLEEL